MENRRDKHGYESWHQFLKFGDFLDYLRKYQLLKEVLIQSLVRWIIQGYCSFCVLRRRICRLCWSCHSSVHIAVLLTVLMNVLYLKYTKRQISPIPVAVRSKACVCGLSLVGIMGSNPADGVGVCLFGVLCVVT